MNITPVSNFSYKAINFKGKNEVSNPNGKKYESQQNNGAEVRISPETYFAMQASSAFDKLEQEGMFEVDEKGIVSMPEEYDMTSEDFDADNFAADMAISALKIVCAQMGADSLEAKSAPTFVKFEYKNYISNLENGIREAKEQLEYMDIPDIDELPTTEELMEEDDLFNPEILAQRALAMLPDMLDAQERMLKLFKTTKASALKETLEECSKTHNYMFLKAINHGFEGNARAVVADLTADYELYNTPEIIDNEDGTLTYQYQDMFSNQYEVIRDKNNGDYISATFKSLDPSKGFELKFNPDGSIKKLDYLNGIDKSLISISQKGNRVIAKQIFNNMVTERTFIKAENGKLRQTSVNVFLKENK